jgi:hypothetical protein
VRDRAAGQQASNSKPKEAGLAAAEQRECGTGRPDSKRATASQRRRGWRRPYSEAGGGRTGGAERLSKGEGGGCTGEGGGCTGEKAAAWSAAGGGRRLHGEKRRPGARTRPGMRPESANPRPGRLGRNWAGPNSSRWQIKRSKRDV